MRSGLVAAMVAVLALPCAAVTFTMEPVQDSYVRAWAPDDNYGSAGGTSVAGASAVNGDGVANGPAEAFMQFDAGPLAAAVDAHFGHHHWAIESAVLHTTEQPNPNNPVYGLGEGQFSIQWIGTQAWDEGTGYPDPLDPTASQTGDGITYNISRSLDLTGPVLGTFANTGPNTTQKFVDLICDLGALPPGLADDLRDGELMSLYLTPADADIGLQFAARDNKTEERRPYLAVEAVEQQAVIPEPATATLLAIGLLAGAGRLRRRRP